MLLEGLPGRLALSEIRSAIAAVQGVAGVHDLHVWPMSTEDVSCTAHVELTEGADPDVVRKSVTDMLEDRFNIEHGTIPTEAETCGEALHLPPP